MDTCIPKAADKWGAEEPGPGGARPLREARRGCPLTGVEAGAYLALESPRLLRAARQQCGLTPPSLSHAPSRNHHPRSRHSCLLT